MAIKWTRNLILTCVLFLQACETTDVSLPSQVESTSSDSLEVDDGATTNTRTTPEPILRALILADMLFEASFASTQSFST